jgi:ABC-type multidrug transport system, ATPase component
MENLNMKSINKTFQKGNIKANIDISTTFIAGEIVALVGHNGAGKTTLLNQIIGNTKPDSGDITYQGKSLIRNTRFARNNVSMMPQLHAPLSGVTLIQAIESVLQIKGVKQKDIKYYSSQIISDLNIEKYKDIPGDRLSGGLQRLTSFAMAVAKPSNIILLDEPTNDVDPVRRKLIWRQLRKLAELGHIVVIVTHNLLEVEQYADRFIMFEQGKILEDSTTGTDKTFTSTLIVDINEIEILNSQGLPSSIQRKYNQSDGQLIFKLSLNQVNDAISWVIQMIEEEKITGYRLSPSSLDVSYGGNIDD